MYFPVISSRYSTSKKRKLSPRAGGGGGGRGGGGSGGGRSGGSSSGRSGGGSSSGRSGGGSTSSSRSSGSVNTGGTSRPATAYGGGGGSVTTIPSGQIFSGRQQGGATRSQIYGTRQYGSGYPGITGRGVAGRGFPFFFWPIAWGGAAGVGGAAYLHSNEYGKPDNSSRPGGPVMTATFVSSTGNSTFGLVADNTTVVELIQDIRERCASQNLNTSSSSTTPKAYNETDPSLPKPESVIQYYRASSVALTLQGYNNSATLSQDEGSPDTPLPSNIDTTLQNCLNQTIAEAVPLIGAGEARWAAPNVGVLTLLWILFYLSGML